MNKGRTVVCCKDECGVRVPFVLRRGLGRGRGCYFYCHFFMNIARLDVAAPWLWRPAQLDCTLQIVCNKCSLCLFFLTCSTLKLKFKIFICELKAYQNLSLDVLRSFIKIQIPCSLAYLFKNFVSSKLPVSDNLFLSGISPKITLLLGWFWD